jgi:ribonuclease P protein component
LGSRDSEPPQKEGSEAADGTSPFKVRECLTKLGFSASYRLTKKSDFTRVVKEGKRIRTRYTEVRMLASPLHHPRVGIIVPKWDRSAVSRNLVKRWLREIVRTELLPECSCGVDLAIRVRRAAYDASFQDLRADIERVKSVVLQSSHESL